MYVRSCAHGGQDGEGGKLLRDRPRDRIDVAVHNVPETPHAGPAMRAVVSSAHLIRRYARCCGVFASAEPPGEARKRPSTRTFCSAARTCPPSGTEARGE